MSFIYSIYLIYLPLILLQGPCLNCFRKSAKIKFSNNLRMFKILAIDVLILRHKKDNQTPKYRRVLRSGYFWVPLIKVGTSSITKMHTQSCNMLYFPFDRNTPCNTSHDDQNTRHWRKHVIFKNWSKHTMHWRKHVTWWSKHTWHWRKHVKSNGNFNTLCIEQNSSRNDL